MNTSETEAVTGEVLSRFAALRFFKNKSFAKLCNLSVTAKKTKPRKKSNLTAGLVPIHLNAATPPR